MQIQFFTVIMKFFNRLIFSLLVLLLPYISLSQINVSTNSTAQQLVQNILVGSGISTSNITFTGSNLSIGSFSNGNSTNIGMDEGIILSTGKVIDIIGPNSLPNTQTNTLGSSDPQLAALIPNYAVYDAVALEFDFVPMSDTIRFQYVFASEEYQEWVGSGYNDVFGFFVTGADPSGGNYTNRNLAIVPGTSNTIVSINTVNNGAFGGGPCNNCSYFVDNTGGTTIEFDGFTVVLTSWLVVTPCTSYHIKLALGDGGDHSYDSGVFLKKNSFSSGILNVNTNYTVAGINNQAVEGCNNALVSFTLDNPSPYNRWINYSIGGSAINGVDYQSIPDSVMIPTGGDSVSFYIIPNLDGITEGTENVQLIIETSSCSTDTIIVPIHDYDSLSVQINGTASICIGQSTSLNATVSNGFGPFTYSWSNAVNTQSIAITPNANTNYNVIVTDACSISDTDSIGVIVHSLPTINVAASQSSICQGQSSNLNVAGANTYVWSPATNLSSTTSDSVIANPNTTTTYTVIGIDTNGCQDTTQTVLTILALPNMQTTPSANSICIGDSIGISASGALSYLWAPSASITNNTTSAVIANPNTTTTYTVIGTAANGCEDSTTSVITVNSLPIIQISPSNPSICIGANKTLSVIGATSYLWSPSASLSSSTGSSVSANPTTTTTYIVEGTDNNSCKSTDTVILTVYSIPTVSLVPANINICEGASTIINATGANTYSWAPSQGLSSTVGSSVTASPIVSATYTATGTDLHGCTDTATTHITVSPNPILTATDTVLCFGDNTNISATASLPGTTFLWSTSATTQIINVSPLVSTTYYVTATDGTGCIGNDSVKVYVDTLPIINISPANPSICIGNSVSITASGAQNYSWSPNTNITSITTAATTVSPSTTTIYTVSGVDANGCINTENVSITVNPLPNVSVSPSLDSICIGTSTTLTAIGAATYSWSPAVGLSATTGNIVTAAPTIPTQYVIVGTDTNGCINNDTAFVFVSPVISVSASSPDICLGDSTLLNVTSNISSTYLWSTGSTQSSFWVTPIDTTSYSVTVTTAAGCTNIGTTTVNVYLRPNVTITPDSSSLCAGLSANLTASGALTYTWQNNPNLSSLTGAVVSASPTSTDSFMVIGVDGSGCRDTAYAEITVFPAITVGVTPSNVTKCQGIPVNLKSSGALTYLWKPAAGLNTTTGDSVIATPNSTTFYKVIGTDSNGCMDSAMAALHINPKPIISINPDTSHLCIGESSSLHAVGAFLYSWSPALGLSSTTGHTVTASPTNTTTYTIIGTSQIGGCLDTTTAYVGVHPYPVLTLSPAATQICPQDSATLTAGGANFYSWSPIAGLSDSTLAVVKASPDSTQIYTVIGSTNYGCTDTLSSTITVSPIPVISGNNYICDGDSTTLSVNSNLANTTFLWSTGSINTTVTVAPINTITYTVTATDQSSLCTNDTSFVVIVNAIPSLSVNPIDTTICPGTTTNITASGANSYLWSPGGSLSSTTASTVTASPAVNTIYALIGSTPAGCSDTVYASVKIFAPANVNVTPITSYSCGGGSQLLTASGALTYLWSPSAGLSTTIGSSVLAGPTSNTAYTVIGTDTNSCTDTAIANVNIYGNPIINPGNPSICPEDSVQLTANTQNAPLSYLWSNGAITQSIYVSPASTAIFSVTVSYPGGCTKSAQTTVTIYTDPVVQASTTTPFICLGDTASLLAQNCVSYSWTGLNLITSSGSQPKANPNANAQYIVQGSSIHSCKTFDTVDVQIYQQASVNIITSQNNICIRDTAQLIASGAQSYIWSPNTNLNSISIDSINVFPTSNQIYQVIGIDTNGCRDTASSLISVNPGPVVTIFPDSPCVCQGDTIDLIASGGATYQWWPLIAISGVTNDTVQVFPVSNITYYVTAYDSVGCSNDTSVYVNVKRKPIIGVIPILDSICIGDSIQLQAFGASTYSWVPHSSLSDSVGSSVTATPISTTIYTVEGTSTDGCTKKVTSTIKVNPNPIVTVSPTSASICIYDSTQLLASGANTYQWSPIGNLSSNIIGDTAIISPLVNTTYKAVGTNQYGCKDSAYAAVQVLALPNVAIAPTNPAICYGDSAQLSASGAINYSWSPSNSLSSSSAVSVWASPLVNTTYVLTGTDIHNCVNTDTVDLVVHPDIIPTANPIQDSICYGLSTSLSVGGGATYLWSPAIGLSSTTNASVIANPLSTQQYNVKVYDIFSCVDSIQIDLTVLPLPNVNISPASTTICYGNQDTLIVTGAQSYIWNPNTNINTLIGDSVICSPLSPQIYYVQGTDSLGCINTDSALISIYSLPNVAIAPTNPAICYGDSAQLSASGAVNYSWSPSNSLSSSSSISVWASPLVNTTYVLTGTDIHNCVNTDTVDLVVHPDIIPTANPIQDSICYGLSTSLSVGGGATYLWSPAIGLSSTTNASVVANPLSTQQYNIKVYDIFSCVDSIQIGLTVLPLPNVNISPAYTAICIGDQDTLAVSGAQSYIWSPNNNISSLFTDTVICSPQSTQQYFVQGTDSLGCINNDSVLITVFNLPNVVISTQDTAICIGDSTQLNASGASQYLWSPNTSISSSTGAVITSNTTNSIWYHVIGTDINSCKNNDSLQILVRPRPQMQISSTDSILCSGYYLGLSGTSNMSATTMIWSTGDTAVSTSDNPITTTTYQLRGINTYGCDDSTQITIQVNPFPILSLSPQDSIICFSDSIDINSTCTLINLSYLWNNGDTTCDIRVAPNANAIYTLIATDSIGCSDTLSTNIAVQPIPTLNITANSTHICANDSLQLIANTAFPVVSYLWNNGNAVVSNSYNPINSFTYFITVTDSIGCQDFDSISIAVNPIPQLQLSAQPNAICIGDTSLLSVQSNISPLNYFWSTNQTTTSISVNPSQSTNYSVYGSDSIGCTDSASIAIVVHNLPQLQINPNPAAICEGDSVLLQVNSNVTINQYQWSNNTNLQSQLVGPLLSSIYSVTATDIYGCVNNTQRLVTVHPNPIISVSPKTDTICTDDSTQLIVNTNIPAQQILWNTGDSTNNPFFAPMISSYYYIVLTDTNGCFGYDTAFVNVIQRPTCQITANSPICSNDSTKVEYQGTASAAATTNWFFDGGNKLLGNGLNPHFLQWSNAGTYIISLDVTENGCTSYPDTAKVIVYQSPVVDFTAIDTSVCDSFAVDFTSIPSAMQSYFWTFGDPLSGGADTSDIQNPSYTYNAPGSYSVSLSVISNDGCPGGMLHNSMINVSPVPIADYITDPPISYSNNPVINFYDKSSSDVNYWEWDFGDVLSGIYNYSNNQNPYHIYQTKGTYFTQLVVKNQWGCSDTAFNQAVIENGPTFFIPDAFTPNGDGLNDLFTPIGTDFIEDSYQIIIYERWGSIVFESNDYNHQWNGKHYKTYEEIPDGVFSYIIFVTDIFDVKRKFVGNITMFR